MKGAEDAFGRMGAAHFYNRRILFPAGPAGRGKVESLLAALEIISPEILCYDEDEE